MFKTMRRYMVRAIGPLDNFEDCTLELHDWLARECFDSGTPWDRSPVRVQKFMEATVAVVQHGEWSGSMRCAPRVAYDASTDRVYFIFKLDHDGTTFLVGEGEVPDTSWGDTYGPTITVEV